MVLQILSKDTELLRIQVFHLQVLHGRGTHSEELAVLLQPSDAVRHLNLGPSTLGTDIPKNA
jgi:hypothetical protein